MFDCKGKDGQFHYLYKTVHLPTNRYYIGKRSEKKISSYLGSGKHLKNAVNKYGKNQFNKTILCFFASGDEAYEAENRYITEEMVKSKDCFNERLGGSGFGMGKDNIVHQAIKQGKHNFSIKEGISAQRAKNRELWAQKLVDAGAHPWNTDKNPTFDRLLKNTHNFQNTKAWNHNIASEMSKNTWSKADEIYEIWLIDKPTYSYLYRLCKDMFDFKFIRQNLAAPVKYFKSGWNPSLDPEWLTFKQNYMVTNDE